MNLSLTYRSSRSVTFRDDTYRWVDEATFSITDMTAQNSTSDVLASLLVDDHYVGAYLLADLVASAVHGQVPGPTQHERYLTALTVRGLTPETDPMRTGHPILWEMSNRPGPDHGPYKLSAIGLSTFDRLDGPGALQVLLNWLVEDGWCYPPDDAIEGDLGGIEADLGFSEVAFRLHDLGERYEHATGWIVQPYLELVAVDLAASRLRLVAAGTD